MTTEYAIAKAFAEALQAPSLIAVSVIAHRKHISPNRLITLVCRESVLRKIQEGIEGEVY